MSTHNINLRLSNILLQLIDFNQALEVVNDIQGFGKEKKIKSKLRNNSQQWLTKEENSFP